MKLLKVGLTGGIGTGKSTVKSILQKKGIPVIDADEVVRKLWQKEDVKSKAVKILEDETIILPTGDIDKKKVASIIFNNPFKKKELENLFHPLVFQYIQDWFSQKDKEGYKFAFAEVPLMIETGSYKQYDKVVLVYAPENLQIKRLLKKGYSYKEALERIKSQMDIEEKKQFADFVLENTGSKEKLEKGVERLLSWLKEQIK